RQRVQRAQAEVELRPALSQPLPRNGLKLISHLRPRFRRGNERHPDAGALGAVEHMADVLTLVASKRELLGADNRLRPDRHHREPQLPIRSIVTDLIESWDPVLPLAIPDESLGPPFKRIRRADRVPQRE